MFVALIFLAVTAVCRSSGAVAPVVPKAFAMAVVILLHWETRDTGGGLVNVKCRGKCGSNAGEGFTWCDPGPVLTLSRTWLILFSVRHSMKTFLTPDVSIRVFWSSFSSTRGLRTRLTSRPRGWPAFERRMTAGVRRCGFVVVADEFVVVAVVDVVATVL